MRKTVAGDAVRSPVLEMNGDEEEQRSPRDARRGNSEGAAEILYAAEHGEVAAKVRRKRGAQAVNGGGESATGKGSGRVRGGECGEEEEKEPLPP